MTEHNEHAVTLTTEEVRLLRQRAYTSMLDHRRGVTEADHYWLPIATAAYGKLRAAVSDDEEEAG